VTLQEHDLAPAHDRFPSQVETLPPQGGELVVPLHVEEVAVSRRQVETAIVRIVTQTISRDHRVDEQLTHERVEIEHVPIGRIVDAVPAVREEGDLTIMPVVEEVLVTERRLMLREEVRIRRVRVTEQHTETVQLREQKAVITRLPVGDQDQRLANPQILTSKLETE